MYIAFPDKHFILYNTLFLYFLTSVDTAARFTVGFIDRRLYLKMQDMTVYQKGTQSDLITSWWMATILVINPNSSM